MVETVRISRWHYANDVPAELLDKAAGIAEWPLTAAQGEHETGPAMVVHLPNGDRVNRWGDERRWDAREAAFGSASVPFWQWQERTADGRPGPAHRRPRPRHPAAGGAAVDLGAHRFRHRLEMSDQPLYRPMASDNPTSEFMIVKSY